MLVTPEDSRREWAQFIQGHADAVPSESLQRSRTGARQLPLEWIAQVEEQTCGSFDRDRGEEVSYVRRILRGWRSAPDPRVRFAGAASFAAIDQAGIGVMASWPGADALGAPGLRVLSIGANEFGGHEASGLGRGSPWEDLVVVGGALWAPSTRAAALDVVAREWSLRGLTLGGARLTADEMQSLAAAPWWSALDVLDLGGGSLAGDLDGFLGHLEGPSCLDLRDLRLPFERLAPHARIFARAERVVLSGNPLGAGGASFLPLMHEVQELAVQGCDLDDRALDALIDSDPPHLRHLFMLSNPLSDDALARLLSSPLGARLQWLSLPKPATLGAALRAALDGHPLAGALGGAASLPGVTSIRIPGRAPSA